MRRMNESTDNNDNNDNDHNNTNKNSALGVWKTKDTQTVLTSFWGIPRINK